MRVYVFHQLCATMLSEQSQIDCVVGRKMERGGTWNAEVLKMRAPTVRQIARTRFQIWYATWFDLGHPEILLDL